MKSVSVNIFPSALDSLRETATRHSPDETGGVMAGTRSFLNGALEFNILGVLGVADFEEFKGIFTVSPAEFVCTDRLGWANLALRAVKTFGMSYIGDWHSHPNSNLASLSHRDIHHLTQQYVLGQFAPYPPLHVLLNWRSSGADFRISAHIMLGEFIAVLEPQIIGQPRS
jgi:proteasome lid subunit RPN8/RPN11